MADLYEFYNTGDNDAVAGYEAVWFAQTFTPAEAHKITSVKLKLWRYGTLGDIIISIRATDAGHPTGGDLCFGILVGNTVTTDDAGAWYEITLGAGDDLDADRKYAIVIGNPEGSSSHQIIWTFDNASPTYTKGNYERSGNSGSTWTSTLTKDFMFEEWGDAAVVAGQPYISRVQGVQGMRSWGGI